MIVMVGMSKNHCCTKGFTLENRVVPKIRCTILSRKRCLKANFGPVKDDPKAESGWFSLHFKPGKLKAVFGCVKVDQA